MSVTMIGRLVGGVLLSYRTPAATVAGLLPRGLELVTRGEWAFWNVVLCRVEDVRPEGAPASCGVTYRHVAYRLLVQAMDDRGELMRGLYFVRSDVDSRAVDVLGRRLTELRPHRATIEAEAADTAASYRVTGTAWSRGEASVRVEEGSFIRPEPSCFPTWVDAVEVLAYPPLSLAVEGQSLKVTRVERDASAWRETPVRVAEAKLSVLDDLGQRQRVLEWATRVDPIDYRWILGERRRLLAGGPLQHEGTPRGHRPRPVAARNRERAVPVTPS